MENSFIYSQISRYQAFLIKSISFLIANSKAPTIVYLSVIRLKSTRLAIYKTKNYSIFKTIWKHLSVPIYYFYVYINGLN